MPYSRAPAWRYFPPTDAPPTPLADVARGFLSLKDWFKGEFWPSVAPGAPMNTKRITAALEASLPADPSAEPLDGGLHTGWNVETRESYSRIPLLYGENGKSLYGVEPDAIYATADGYRALLEIEGGGAVQTTD